MTLAFHSILALVTLFLLTTQIHSLYLIQHRVTHVSNTPSSTPFHSKAFIKISQKNGVISKIAFVPLGNDTLRHWDGVFFDAEIDTQKALYEMRLCEIVDLESVTLEALGSIPKTCDIARSVPYCEIVSRQFREEWGVHYVKGLGEDGDASTEPRIVGLELLSNVKPAASRDSTPEFVPAVTYNPLKVPYPDTLQCASVLSKWRHQQQRSKGTTPKYRVTFRAFPGVSAAKIPYLTYQKVLKQQEQQEIKQQEEQKVPFYRKYWYIVLGVVLLIISSAFGSGEEDEKS